MNRDLRNCLAGLLLSVLQACGLTLLSASQEIAMGLEAYPQATSEYEAITSGSDYERLQRVMRKIVPHADPDVRQWYGDMFQWEVRLLDAPQTVNAWCLPGGKMAFYTGILPICQGDDGVAVVMSHEIAHAVKRHGNQRISQNLILKGVLAAGSIALSSSNPAKREQSEQLMAALGLGIQYGIQLPYSRGHESEADAYGLELLIKAGYDPWESVRLWERMAARSASRPPEFMSTHPDPLNRARALAELIPKLQARIATR